MAKENRKITISQSFNASIYGSSGIILIQIPNSDGGAFIQGNCNITKNGEKVHYNIARKGYGHSGLEARFKKCAKEDRVFGELYKMKCISPDNTWHDGFDNGDEVIIEIEVEIEVKSSLDVLKYL